MTANGSGVTYGWLESKKAYILDSCTFLWAVADDKKLSAKARKLIEDSDNTLYVSTASAYEISYKNHLGKLGEYKIVADNFEAILHKLGARQSICSND